MDYTRKIEEIFMRYKRSCAKLMRQGIPVDAKLFFSDADEEINIEQIIENINKMKKTKNDDELFIQQVNFVFSLLTKNEKKIILNDYFFNLEHVWYEMEFSRATYYRLREAAVRKFLKLMGEIE